MVISGGLDSSSASVKETQTVSPNFDSNKDVVATAHTVDITMWKDGERPARISTIRIAHSVDSVGGFEFHSETAHSSRVEIARVPEAQTLETCRKR